jgi:hypothetical protein
MAAGVTDRLVDVSDFVLEDAESKKAAWRHGAEPMNFRQRLQQRDFWLHLDFNVAVAVVVVVTLLTYVVSKFMG